MPFKIPISYRMISFWNWKISLVSLKLFVSSWWHKFKIGVILLTSFVSSTSWNVLNLNRGTPEFPINKYFNQWGFGLIANFFPSSFPVSTCRFMNLSLKVVLTNDSIIPGLWGWITFYNSPALGVNIYFDELSDPLSVRGEGQWFLRLTSISWIVNASYRLSMLISWIVSFRIKLSLGMAGALLLRLIWESSPPGSMSVASSLSSTPSLFDFLASDS